MLQACWSRLLLSLITGRFTLGFTSGTPSLAMTSEFTPEIFLQYCDVYDALQAAVSARPVNGSSEEVEKWLADVGTREVSLQL